MSFEIDEALPLLIQRLEVALSSVNVALQKKKDAQLIERLEQGTYTQEDLDTLFTEVEGPFRFAAVAWTTCLWSGPVLHGDPYVDDPLYQLVLALSDEGAAAGRGIDLSGRVDLETDPRSHRKRALTGLVRRLVEKDGIAQLRDLARNAWQATSGVMEESEILIEIHEASSQGEVDRLLRLVAPLERDHPCSLLVFTDPTGELVKSRKPSDKDLGR